MSCMKLKPCPTAGAMTLCFPLSWKLCGKLSRVGIRSLLFHLDVLGVLAFILADDWE